MTLAVILAGALPALAQTNPILTERPMTVEECAALGLENSPMLAGSRAGIDLAEARNREAVAARLPWLKATAGYTRMNTFPPFVLDLPLPGHPVTETLVTSTPNNYLGKLTLQQPLFTGFRLQSANALAAENTRAARSDFARDQADVLYQVRSSYWRLYQAVQSRAVVDRNIDRMQAHLTDILRLQTQGLATRNDVLKVRVQLDNARLARLDAASGVELASTALANLIGVPLDNPIKPVSSPGDTSVLSDSLPILIRKALAQRPEIKSLDARLRASSAGVGLARSAWYPQIAAFGDIGVARPNSREFPPVDKFTPSWDFGVSASFDVWNWGMAGHQTAEAKAQMRQLTASYVQVRNGIVLEVTQDYLTFVKAGARIAAAETALAQAEENQRVAQDGLTAGIVSTTDLLDADVNLLQAQLNLAQAQADLEISRAKMEKTLGESR